jgi:hypothetical protein
MHGDKSGVSRSTARLPERPGGLSRSHEPGRRPATCTAHRGRERTDRSGTRSSLGRRFWLASGTRSGSSRVAVRHVQGRPSGREGVQEFNFPRRWSCGSIYFQLRPFDCDQTGRRGEEGRPPGSTSSTMLGSLTGLTRPPHETHASTRKFVRLPRFRLQSMSPNKSCSREGGAVQRTRYLEKN